MTEPQQPQYAWTLTGPGANAVHAGDVVADPFGPGGLQVRIVALQPYPGGVQVTAERVNDDGTST
jgi:hypothetical protein